jgi:hypothetical protein
LSVLGTGRLYPPGIITDTHLCYRLSQPQGRGAAERMSIKNASYTTGNRTCDLTACRTVPQPTAPPRTPTLPTTNTTFYTLKTLVSSLESSGVRYWNGKIISKHTVHTHFRHDTHGALCTEIAGPSSWRTRPIPIFYCNFL